MHTRLVEKAAEWTSNYERIGTEKKFQTSLANWLERERYDEDLPIAYDDPKDAAVSRNRANGKAKAKPGAEPAELAEPGKHGHTLPRGTHVMTIARAEALGSQLEAWAIKLTLTGQNEQESEHTFWPIHNHDDMLMERGQRLFAEVSRATDMRDDIVEAVGKNVLVTVKNSGEVSYLAA